jgi:hypothetical protein
MGGFSISTANNVLSFRFTINLHIDDKEALEFIKNRLNCGTIFLREKTANFYLTKIDDIKTILIPLFEKFPLNGVKYLDYLAFKEAITIKLDDSLSKSKKFELITALKDSMKTKRVNFAMPSTHTIRITPYWLLGLIEGEGSFCLNDPKNMGISFNIALTYVQASLINAIKNFLDTYLIDDVHLKASPNYQEIISKRSFLSVKKKSTNNSNPAIEISIRQVNFIVDKFIPMLSNLNFVTKKYKDFLDWGFIAYLIYNGKHTTEAGRELIIKISKGMNNYRLSTFKDLENEMGFRSAKIPQSLIDEVLNMENIYIKDQDGLRIDASTLSLVKSQLFYILAKGSNGEKLIFKDSKTCAEYFGITSQALNIRLAKKLLLVSNNVKFKLSRKSL